MGILGGHLVSLQVPVTLLTLDPFQRTRLEPLLYVGVCGFLFVLLVLPTLKANNSADINALPPTGMNSSTQVPVTWWILFILKYLGCRLGISVEASLFVAAGKLSSLVSFTIVLDKDAKVGTLRLSRAMTCGGI